MPTNYDLTGDPRDPAFLQSREWRLLRRECERRAGGKCERPNCHRRAAYGEQLHAHHKLCRSLYPELSLDPANIEMTCWYHHALEHPWLMADMFPHAANDLDYFGHQEQPDMFPHLLEASG